MNIWKRYSMRVSKNWVKFNKMFTLSPCPLGSACSMEINNWSHHINAARIIPLFVKNNSWRRLSIGIVIENK